MFQQINSFSVDLIKNSWSGSSHRLGKNFDFILSSTFCHEKCLILIWEKKTLSSYVVTFFERVFTPARPTDTFLQANTWSSPIIAGGLWKIYVWGRSKNGEMPTTNLWKPHGLVQKSNKWISVKAFHFLGGGKVIIPPYLVNHVWKQSIFIVSCVLCAIKIFIQAKLSSTRGLPFAIITLQFANSITDLF